MKNKLKEQKGITMIYALLGLLVFMVISSLIFNAAQSNYTRALKEKEDEQAYLTVNSAANVFVESIADDQITMRQDITNMYSGNPIMGSMSAWTYEDNGMKVPESNDFSFSDILLKMAKDVYDYSNTSDGFYRMKVSSEEEKEVEDVLVYMEMKDYDLTLVFASSNSEHPNYITVEIPSVRNENGEAGFILDEVEEVEYDAYSNQISHCLYKIEWNRANISIRKGNSTGVNLYEEYE